MYPFSNQPSCTGFKEVPSPSTAAETGSAAISAAAEADSDSEDDDTKAQRHAAHMFKLSFTQYVRELRLVPACSDLAFENAVSAHSSIRTLGRLGSLLVSRGKELEQVQAMSGSSLGVHGGGEGGADGSQRAGKSRRSGATEDAAESGGANSATAVAPSDMGARQCFSRGAQCLYRCWELDTSGDWLTPATDRALESCVARGLDVGVTHA